MASASNITYLLKLLWQKIVFAWQIEVAYAGNVVGNLISTFIYNVTFIIFLDIIIKRVDSFSGYSFGDMLVYAFISQIIYYSQSFISFGSSNQLVADVRSGNFDVYILKPISLMFQAMTSILRPFSSLLFATPTYILYIWLIISNNAFNPTSFGLLVGVFSTVVGVLIMNFYRFSLATMVFFFKQSKNITKTADITSSIGQFPYDVFRFPVKIFVSILVPFYLAAAIPVEYILNRVTTLNLFYLQIVICILFVLFTNIIWKKGLKAYDSASS